MSQGKILCGLTSKWPDHTAAPAAQAAQAAKEQAADAPNGGERWPNHVVLVWLHFCWGFNMN